MSSFKIGQAEFFKQVGRLSWLKEALIISVSVGILCHSSLARSGRVNFDSWWEKTSHQVFVWVRSSQSWKDGRYLGCYYFSGSQWTLNLILIDKKGFGKNARGRGLVSGDQDEWNSFNSGSSCILCLYLRVRSFHGSVIYNLGWIISGSGTIRVPAICLPAHFTKLTRYFRNLWAQSEKGAIWASLLVVSESNWL